MIRYSFLSDPTPDQLAQLLALYRMAGWWSNEGDGAEVIVDIVAGSHCFLIAVSAQTIVGMGRAISDGISDAYIQDVTVNEKARGQGIGTKIVEHLVDRLHRDGLGWIGLIAERNSHEFYIRIGFKKMADSVPMLMISK